VRVPDEAGVGTAKATFSFATRKEGRVAPARMEIPVIKAKSSLVESKD